MKDAATGEVMVVIRPLKGGLSVEESTVTIRTPIVKYFLDGWPQEDVLTFLDAVAATLRKLIVDAYDAFPNGFELHRSAVPIARTKGDS